MKKSLRILSLVLAIVLAAGSMSVMGYAYDAYRGTGASVVYDDVDTAALTIDQYASMALDEVDRMLAEENLVVDVYIGTLDLSDVNTTLSSVVSLVNSVGTLLNTGLLGDQAPMLKDPVLALAGVTREGTGDLNVIYDLLDLIGSLGGVLKSYVNGSIGLGILNSFIQEYVFNVRELVFGLLIDVTGMMDTEDHDFDFFDGDVVPAKYATMDSKAENGFTTAVGDSGALVFIQDILNDLVLGDWMKLDDLFYDPVENPNSHVVASEYIWSTKSGNTLTKLPDDEAIDTAHYDYYGYVHPEWWVTFGLGDAIRVTSGAAAPAPSYTKVDVIKHVTSGQVTYDLIEDLILQAYNGIAVPVLNRITKQWLREKAGFYFDPLKTEKYEKDEEGKDKRDENGDKIISATYDYMYMGEAVTGAEMDDIIFSIFDPDLVIPRAYARQGHTFIQDLNSNAVQFALSILKTTGDPVVAFDNSDPDNIKTAYTATWSGKDWMGVQRTFTLTLLDQEEDSNALLFDNIAEVAKFVLKITGDGFFSKEVSERGEVITDPDEIDALTTQQLGAYIIRSVINASVDWMYIEPEYDTIATAAFRAVQQLLWQDLPQFTYTMPERDDYTSPYAWYKAVVEKALAALMDLAAYNVNQGMDTNFVNKTTGYSKTNVPGNNGTGLLGYLGDVGSYGDTIVVLAAWAISKYGPLLNIDFTCDDYNGAYANLDVWDFWSDFDALINAIIPITNGESGTPDGRSWIASSIAEADYSAYSFLMDHIIMAVADADLKPFTEVFDKNPDGAFQFDNLETVIVDLLHRIFDDLFPGVFTHTSSTIDSVLDNALLGDMVENLAYSLSYSKTYQDSEGNTLRGRGEAIAYVALPLVCMILGLDSPQEFSEMETYMPSVFATTKKDANGNWVANTTTTFEVFNGSSGLNTSYRDKDDSFKRKTDKLFTYKIASRTCKVISGTATGTNLAVNGLTANTLIEGGKTASVSVSGYSAGQVLEMTINYYVLDENGNSLTKDANDQDTTLTYVSYAYVGATAEGDDETRQTINIGGQNIQYTSDYYIAGGKGLTGLDSYSFRIKNESGTGTVTVKSVTVSGKNVTTAGDNQWVTLEGQGARAADYAGEITQSLAGQGGTYVFTPFVVDSNAKRTDWNYEKDSSGNYVYDSCGMRVKTTKVARTAPEYEVEDGTYIITTRVQVGSSVDEFETRVHIYNDYGLDGLFNRAVAANRTTGTITSAGQTYFTSYASTLQKVAAFALQPRQFGSNYENHIKAVAGDGEGENRFEQLYRALYTEVERIKKYEVNAGAQAIWNKVNATESYNYTRTAFSLNNKTYYYKNTKEFDEAGYGFFGIRNYVAHTFNVWRLARNDANSLINREFFYVPYMSQEDYNALTGDAKKKYDAALANYENAVANATAISSVESAYAIHRLDIASSRLITLPADKTKLNAVITQYSNLPNNKVSTYFASTSYAEYSRALAFANTTAGDSNATPQQVNEAMSMVIETWKALMRGADYSTLDNKVNEIKNILRADGAGLNPAGQVVIALASNDEQEVYTEASLINLLNAIIAAEGVERGLSISDQGKIDKLYNELVAAYGALVAYDPAGPGDDPDDPPVSGDLSWALPDPDSDDYADYQIFQTSFGIYQYAPVIDEETCWLDNIGGLTVGEYTEDAEFAFAGESVDYIIYGISEDMSEDDIGSIFAECEGYEISYDANDWGAFSTGSYIYLIPEDEDEDVVIFMLVLRGDTDGSGLIEDADVVEIQMYIAGVDDYIWDDPDCPTRHFITAGDVDGSGDVNDDDTVELQMFFAGNSDIYQPLGNWNAPEEE